MKKLSLQKRTRAIPLLYPLLLLLAAAPAWSQGARGQIEGVAYDANSGNTLPQVKVEIAGPEATISAVTDLDGKFRVELPAGTYNVTYTSANHMKMTVEGVVVTAAEMADASTVLAASNSVTEIDVVESVAPQIATAESMLTERKLASTVSDSISSAEIQQSNSSDAASALTKVTGVSVVDDRFVYVRGLGERYSATTLNNALVATTEPERRVVPLDLFPANLLDNVKVLKTYSADLPGEFSAGLVQVNTIEFPSHPTFEVSHSIGFNTRTTFDNFLTYPGGGLDFFGFDDGTRSLPDIIPTDKPVNRFHFSRDELQQFGRAFSDHWAPVVDNSARPSQSYSVVAGRSFGKLGLVGAVTFSNDLQSLAEVRNFYTPGTNGGPPSPFNTYDYNSSTVAARVGGLLNIAYQFNPAHKIVLKNFVSHDTDNESRVFQGYNRDFARDIRNSRLRWVERTLISTQLEGEHLFSGLGNTIFNWQLGYSRATRYEPDLRENLYQRDPATGEFRFRNESQSAYRMFNDLEDNIYQPSVAVLKPFYWGGVAGNVKFGAAAAYRKRDFMSRRLRLNQYGTVGLDFFEPPDTLFREENIRPNAFEIVEETRATDRYHADRNVYAGFGQVDLAFSPKWRLIAGLRVEKTDQLMATFNPFDPTLNREESPYESTDPLPAVNVIYALTPRSNLRFGFSQTVSRPDFRELALFDFLDVTGGRLTVGNPNLIQAKIQNYDARWELFPGGNQLLAASFFYKNFSDPIEQVIQPSIGLRTSFDNAKNARNAGMELEFRRNLEFLNPRLRPFAISANFTLVDSRIDLTGAQKQVLTSLQRPMAGQSRYIYNIIGEWSKPKWRSTTRVYLNSFSKRISDVGAEGLPDVYQNGATTLDVVYELEIKEGGRWKMRFSAQNLTDANWLWTQGGETFRQYYRGRTFTIGNSFRIK